MSFKMHLAGFDFFIKILLFLIKSNSILVTMNIVNSEQPLYFNDPYPLPNDNDNICIKYNGKIDEKQILSSIQSQFCIIHNDKIDKIDKIPYNSFNLTDNFIGLHKLINQGVKIDLIYTDPPYRTGSNFQSKNFEDAYSDKMKICSYIEFIRRRLILMRELLADDGSIYVHIGHQMLFHVKLIMDEIFGAKNFRNIITRKKCSSKNFTKNQYPNVNDYILFYTKTKKYKWNKVGVKPSEEWIEKEYNKIDNKGRYKLVPIHAPGVRNGKTGEKWRGMNPPNGKHWQFTPEKLDELEKNGEIYWSKNKNPRRKVYLTQDKLLPLNDYWENFRDAHHQSCKITGYPTEKNFDMVKTIIKASSEPNDLILDPFSGSGTTLHAAHDLKRNWIGFDNSFVSAKTIINRLNYGTKKIGHYNNDIKNTISHKKIDFNFLIHSNLLQVYSQKDFLDIVNS